jgi:hypothetical protein
MPATPRLSWPRSVSACRCTPYDGAGFQTSPNHRSTESKISVDRKRPIQGLLGLHPRYGPLNCSTAHGGLCHEASTQMVAHPGRSSATGSIDNSPGGSYLPGDTRIQGALHSITSSARVRKDSGIVNPRAFAVARLTTRSNLVGCWTGKSPGFAPRRILSTYSAARRFRSR